MNYSNGIKESIKIFPMTQPNTDIGSALNKNIPFHTARYRDMVGTSIISRRQTDGKSSFIIWMKIV